ncbi:MAG: LuxR family transcriptional regulator [Sphingobacteriales bacterium]|nr:MAG: LuxR family transcriptional regulator [Sphingobacteriales bacterium]
MPAQPINTFEERLNKIREMADELPVSVIVHRIDTLQILYMNKPGLESLGTTLESLQRMDQEQYFIKFFNTDDSADYVPKIINIIKSEQNEQASYFQQVKVVGKKEWQLYVSNTKVFERNASGEPTHLLTIASLLDPEHHITNKVNRLTDEVSFLRKNNLVFSRLTKREIEVLKFMAMGLNSGEIAEKLYISTSTADTHRRNIRNKLGVKNYYDVVLFAQAYDLV